MKADSDLKKHVVELLHGGHAHADFDAAVRGLPAKLRGAKPEGQPFTAWRLVEHMRLAQWDILEFSRDPKHVSPDWPAGYWPKTQKPPDSAAWAKSVRSLEKDLASMVKLVTNPKTD